MGLDNGIEIRRKENLPNCVLCFDEKWRKERGYDLEVAYWRKCWNVRSAIGDALGSFYDNGQTDVNRDEVLAIIKELKKFNKKNWECCGWNGSIWEWSEIKHHHRRCIRRLRRLARLMKKYPTIEVYFYDSY